MKKSPLLSSPLLSSPLLSKKDLQGSLMQAGRKGNTLWALLSAPAEAD